MRAAVISKAAAAVALPLLWSNRALPALRLGIRGRTAANTAFATGYALVFQGNPNWTSSHGRRIGAATAGMVLSGYVAALAIPDIRRHFAELADRGPEVSTAEWAGVHIPVGTVLSEELVYRATLTPLLEETFGNRGTLLGALTFGLSHIRPARAAGDPAPGTVAVTTLAGLVLDRLYRRTASATAPALLHLALNAGGALTPVAARRVATATPPPAGARPRAAVADTPTRSH
ncbi:CPBP family intramembrane glutamic endopeptidase [Nocardia sp. NBC_01388]|uniref:CPBP family intramembrane glutamic endopeptidase n=1 Tax=Nocardia sp. NBC_01388 TaxID=2903596 RepID=UPI00324A0206